MVAVSKEAYELEYELELYMDCSTTTAAVDVCDRTTSLGFAMLSVDADGAARDPDIRSHKYWTSAD